MTTVTFAWKLNDQLRQHFQSHLQIDGLTLQFPQSNKLEDLSPSLPNTNILVGWKLDDELLAQSPNLELFINPGAGVQHLLEVFRNLPKDRPITLTNSHGNASSTAQHALAMLLALSCQLLPHHQWLKAGRWRTGDDDARSIPLKNQAIGLLGYGAINQHLHTLLAPFKPQIGILRRSSQTVPNTRNYQPDQLLQFFEDHHSVVIAIPLTTDTKGLISSQHLQALGPEGLLVNIARGPVIDEKDLYQALANKTIAAAAIDVWYQYRPEPDDQDRKFPFTQPFHKLDNILLSPHRAASPFDDRQRWHDVIANIRRAHQQQPLLNVIDLQREY